MNEEVNWMPVLVALNDFSLGIPWLGCAAAEGLHFANAELGSYWDYLMAVAITWKISFTSNPDKVFLHGLRSSNMAFSSGLGLLVKQCVNVVLALMLVSYGKANLSQPQSKCFHSCPCFEMGVNCWKCGKLWC